MYYIVRRYKTWITSEICRNNTLFLFNRDDPKSSPVFAVSNQAKKSCQFTVLGENLFAAVR